MGTCLTTKPKVITVLSVPLQSKSPATTTSATRPWSAPRCATPCTPTTAHRSPCSASPPPPGRWPRATRSSAGRDRCARRTCRAIVGNPRFLILPWIHIHNLGSHILAIVRRQLPVDWTARYNTTPVLIETFVETPRYTGAVYRASGWTHVGATQGRGRYDTKKRRDKPKRTSGCGPCARTVSASSTGRNYRKRTCTTERLQM